MSNDHNPWGKRPEQGPPDLFELMKKLFSKAKQSASGSSVGSVGQLPTGSLVVLVLGAVLFIWIIAGIFVVKPAEQAVMLRFGKYTETLAAGPHWAPPFIERRFIVNTQEVRNFPYRSEMLTRDENIVSVAVAVQYRVADPKQYLFHVIHPVDALQQAASSALRQVVGQMSLDDVLTTGRQSLRDHMATQLNTILAMYQTGLEVTDVTLQPAKPPEEVTAAFDDAIKAREDEQRYINQAQAYVRQVTSTAKGQIARLTQSAKAYQQEAILRAQGQTARFLALLHAYQKAPAVTRERLYLEDMESVLSQTHTVIMDSGNSNLLYVPLKQLLKKPIVDQPVESQQ